MNRIFLTLAFSLASCTQSSERQEYCGLQVHGYCLVSNHLIDVQVRQSSGTEYAVFEILENGKHHSTILVGVLQFDPTLSERFCQADFEVADPSSIDDAIFFDKETCQGSFLIRSYLESDSALTVSRVR